MSEEKKEEFMNPPVEGNADVKADEKPEVKAEEAKTEKKSKPATATKKARTIGQKLVSIQTTIKAPKNLYNSYGNYNYRNAEGILESVKPYLEREGCILLLEDKIEVIGDRYYVKATATLKDAETADEISVSAFARESLEKKGMDSSQVTGATSSYARKYALNGLFLLDDTKDADTDEYAKSTGKEKSSSNGGGKQNFSGNNNSGSNSDNNSGDVKTSNVSNGEPW